MKKVVLYLPEPQSYARPWKGVPLGLLAISRVLYQKGYQIKIISRFLSAEPEKDLIEECKDSICLGISAMVGFQIYDGLQIAKLIKNKYPKLPIIWGGWHASILSKQTLESRYVDIIVRGKGDSSFPELVMSLEEKKDLKGIRGISYKKNGVLYQNPDRDFEDINKLPPLPYDVLDMEKCLLKSGNGERASFYVTSYGCPYNCGFCVEPIVNKRRWVGLSAEKTVKDIFYLNKKYGVNSFMLCDNNFFVDKKRVYDIFQGLIKNKLNIKLTDVAGRAPELIKYEPDIWETMQKGGLKSICVGAESALNESLKLINKQAEAEDVVKLTELCEKYKIRILYSFMTGLPRSKNINENIAFNQREHLANLQLIDRLLKMSNRNKITYYVYLPYPGSTLFNRAVDLGLKYPNSLDSWSRYLLSPEDGFEKTKRQRWISASQAREISMLHQYIFAVLDPTCFSTLNYFPKGLKRTVFKYSYYCCRFLVKIRWKYRFFSLPIDYRIFNYFRKNGYFS